MSEKLNILVVDDEEIMRNLFTDILRDEGYEVTAVSSGKEAEDTVRQESFDIAFIDVHMPVMDGIMTLRSLKEICPNLSIVMTDSMPNYVVEETKKEGAITCIRKPFNINEVRSIIDKIIKKA